MSVGMLLRNFNEYWGCYFVCGWISKKCPDCCVPAMRSDIIPVHAWSDLFKWPNQQKIVSRSLCPSSDIIPVHAWSDLLCGPIGKNSVPIVVSQ